jgi:hypothetical protein
MYCKDRLQLVFESPVRSGFLTSKEGNRTHNRVHNFQIWATMDWTDMDRFFAVFCIPGLFQTGCNQILDRTAVATGYPMYQLPNKKTFREIG